jgi:8-oxo-dGTP diphosphatase
VNAPHLRPAVRAIIIDESDHILLCRWNLNGLTVWGTPGGGIDEGESHSVSLRRELLEEVGFELVFQPPHVWHQVIVAPYHASPEFDGVINDFYLVRAAKFEPRGTLSDAELANENLLERRWWPLAEIADYSGDAVFAPRNLAPLVEILLRDGVPELPIDVGL